MKNIVALQQTTPVYCDVTVMTRVLQMSIRAGPHAHAHAPLGTGNAGYLAPWCACRGRRARAALC
jgi:hypothetical protein